MQLNRKAWRHAIDRKFTGDDDIKLGCQRSKTTKVDLSSSFELFREKTKFYAKFLRVDLYRISGSKFTTFAAFSPPT